MATAEESANVWLVIRKAAYWIEQHALRSVTSTGLGLTDFAVLKALLFTGPLPVNVIGAKVLLTSGSITSAVDRLAAQGLVERQAHPTDRRASLVGLTRAGEDLIRPASRRHARTMAALISALTDAEQRELVRLTKKLGKHAMNTYQKDQKATVIPLELAGQRASAGKSKEAARRRGSS